MIVGKAIYYLLTNATDVTDIVSARVYPEVAQQDADLPFIVYNVTNNEPSDTKPEPSKLDTAQVEVNIYSDSYTQAIDLAVAVRAALDRVKGTYNGVNVQSIQYQNEVIDFDEPQRAYNISADYDVRISRSGFEIAQGSPITGVQLGELSDVDVTGVTNGQLIAYNSTSGNWEAANDAGGANELSDLSDASVSLPSDGEVLIYSGGEFVNDNIAISNVTGLQAALDAAPDNLRELTDVTISGLADNDYLQYDSASGTWQNSTLILGRNGEQYTGNYDSEAETLLDGATETVELYYTAQADGDGLHEDAQTDTATTGFDIRRKLYYAEKAQADPNTSGDWTQFADIADDTTYASAKATLLAYLKARTGGTVPISLKMTWEEVAEAPSFTGLLNESYGGGAAAAYGTRRLNGNYTGACMTIRRASDGTTTTIGFDGEDIDEAAIETFCTGTTCTVQVWHDQSQSGGTGSGNDASQTTPANQPTIYTGGALVKEGGRLALDFDGSNDNLGYSGSIGISGTNARTYTAVFNPEANTQETVIQHGDNSSGSNMQHFILTSELANRYYGSNNVFQISNTSQMLVFNPLVGDSAHDTEMYLNGAQLTYTSRGSDLTLNTADSSLNIGVQNVGSLSGLYGGTMQEIIIYSADKSSVRTSIEGNISGYYQSAKLLNEAYGSGAAAAYSVRQLNRDYTGAALQVERSSDNTTQDIGFDSNGDLDESALTTFCTGTTCRVRTWYDQATAGGTGSGNDAVQTTHANQPTIYTGGAIVKENGRVAVDFNKANSEHFEFTSADFAGDYIDLFLTGLIDTYSSNGSMLLGSTTGGATYWQHGNTDGYFVQGAGSGTAIAVNNSTRYLFNQFSNSTTINAHLSGADFSDSFAVSAIPSGSRTYLLGKYPTGTNWNYDGKMQEFVAYPSQRTTGNRTSIESNIGDYFTQNTPLLDTYTGAAAAYSLRKLRSAYSGSAIRVRRASDNTEQDIGFNVFGELDTVSLTSFCSGTDGFVKTWYCQSGNSRDVTQTNTANQPKIYDSTTGVVTRNGKPFVMFSTDLGGLPHFQTNHSFTTSANDEIIISVVYEATTDREEIFQLGDIGMTANYLSSEIMDFNGVNCRLLAKPTQGTALSHVLMFADGTDIKGRANGAAYATDASDPISGETSGVQTSTTQVEIGRLGNNFCNESYIAEFVLYPSYSAIETGLESNVNTFYSIY